MATENDDQAQAVSDGSESTGPSAEPTTVVVTAKRLSSDTNTTTFSETLQVKEQVTAARSVSEVLSEAVGVQVRSLGGLGSYGAASIRGSTSSQVPVFLDGVLLNAGGFAAVNLGDLSLDALEQIHVFRGITPASIGTAGIGGALVLQTRGFERPRTEAAVSLGSFNTVRLFGLHARRLGHTRMLTLFTMTTSEGNFKYLNRNGTLFNPDDDLIQKRQNNGHLGLDGLVKLQGAWGGWRWQVADSVFGKEQGVAGIDSVPTEKARLVTARNALQFNMQHLLATGLRLVLEANHLFMREDFDDSYLAHGELGLGRQHNLTSTQVGGLGGLVQWEPSGAHLSQMRIDARLEQLRQSDELLDRTIEPKTRLRLAMALQHEFKPDERFSLQPIGRAEWLHGVFGGEELPGGQGWSPPAEIDYLHWQASLGLRWRMTDGLTFRVNAGRTVRTPDLTEMFGDRGVIIGNPDLRPEVGFNADAGLVGAWSDLGALSSLRFELVAFGSLVDDVIVFVQNSQSSVRSENIDKAEITGLESSLRMNLWDWLLVSANHTFLHAINRSDTAYHSGKRLPGRPEHEIYARIEARLNQRRQAVGFWLDMDYAGRNYLDPANLKEDALARLLFGAGLRLHRFAEGLTVTLQVKNLFDTYVLTDSDGLRRPLRDFEAFPLPGRTIMTTVHWKI